jgi:hypothetical protein
MVITKKQFLIGTAMAEQNTPFPREKKPPHTQGHSPPHFNPQKVKPIGGLTDLSSFNASGRPLALPFLRSERRFSGYWNPAKPQELSNKLEAIMPSNLWDDRWEH